MTFISSGLVNSVEVDCRASYNRVDATYLFARAQLNDGRPQVPIVKSGREKGLQNLIKGNKSNLR